MIKNYLKTAIRSLKKQIGFTVINILGLSIGLATCLLIVCYVADELSYDRYNTQSDRIYRVTVAAGLNGHEGVYATSEGPLQEALKADFPEIEQTTRMIDKKGLFRSTRKFFIKKGTENIEESKVVFTESSLFSVFTLPLISGQPAGILNEPHSAVITESAARKYFNSTDITGRTLIINDTSLYKITGVARDIPAQSHFHYDFFLSFSSLPESRVRGWGYSGIHNYLLVRPGTDTRRLESRIGDLQIAHSPASPKVWTTGGNYFKTMLTPLRDIHLRSGIEYELEQGGSKQYVYIFSVIALFILLIACANFMNLSTARSADRAKEVGVRKVLGSSRGYLVAQFLTESVLVTLAATIVAIVLVVLCLPLFSQLSGKTLLLTAHSLFRPGLSLLAAVILIGLLAGSYPAFFLSGFRPIAVLKGRLAAGFRGSRLRSSLVVFQFAISVFLIIGTLVINNQLSFIRNKNLGFDRSQLLVIKNTSGLGRQAMAFNEELRQLPGVVSTTMSSYLPTGNDRLKTGLFPDREIDIKKDMLTEFWAVDENYLRTVDIHLASGRNFSGQMPTDTAAILVNEAFVKKYGVKAPLNKTVYRASYGVQEYHIIGVVKDFNFESLRNDISPLALVYAPNNGAISVKLQTSNLSALMAGIEKKWRTFSPNQRPVYSFADADFDATYHAEQRVGMIFTTFSTLAIFIACLGLFGLAAYAAGQRSKEIGIRKVLGAGVSNILRMLSYDFIKLVIIAIAVATPIAWWTMHQWLQDFAYRTIVHWWIPAVAGLAALLIAFITISFQSLKAALANPVGSLHDE